uniref:Uncharacterized protein n=1 Tax=viral metagenome TaxID=1070528 RepID=A0A6H1ZM25_9ZZZZ
MTHPLPPRRFRMHEIVLMPNHPACLARVRGHEDGRYLRHGFPGWVYHVEIDGNDSLAARGVIVGEDELRKLTEE